MSMICYLLRVTTPELEGYLKDSSLLAGRIDNAELGDPNLIEIDKAWEGVMFLLTGQCLAEANHPLWSVLFSNQVIDEEQDMGYGPANYVSAEQVKELNEQITSLTIAELKHSYDPVKMMELGIYPEIWDEDDQAFAYLGEYFAEVQRVYQDAASNNEAIITFVS